jgi:hypothetical protein
MSAGVNEVRAEDAESISTHSKNKPKGARGLSLAKSILYVIKPDVSSFLDTVREVHSQGIEELNALVEEYISVTSEPLIKLVQTKARGYHL